MKLRIGHCRVNGEINGFWFKTADMFVGLLRSEKQKASLNRNWKLTDLNPSIKETIPSCTVECDFEFSFQQMK